jgi:hypothetical protein
MDRYAGVVLDFYDDNGEQLKNKFPTTDTLPEFIKQANVRPKDSLVNEDFALVAQDGANILRKFACTDAGTTAMSVMYFFDNKDKLPDEAVKTAAANLTTACLQHGLLPPARLIKMADAEKLAGIAPEAYAIIARSRAAQEAAAHISPEAIEIAKRVAPKSLGETIQNSLRWRRDDSRNGR